MFTVGKHVSPRRATRRSEFFRQGCVKNEHAFADTETLQQPAVEPTAVGIASCTAGISTSVAVCDAPIHLSMDPREDIFQRYTVLSQTGKRRRTESVLRLEVFSALIQLLLEDLETTRDKRGRALSNNKSLLERRITEFLEQQGFPLTSPPPHSPVISYFSKKS